MAEVVGGAASALGTVISAGEAIAAAVPTHRQCNVEVNNACQQYSLCNPRMYLESGWCEIPQSPFVDSGTSDVAVFVKTPHTASGSVGVITYDLQHNETKEISKKMAVMFSVPYNLIGDVNVYAAGIFDRPKECDEKLFTEMYEKSNSSFVRKEAREPGCLIYRGDTFTIMATMSDAYQPVIKLRITPR